MRSESCRRTTSAKLRWSAGTFNGPCSRIGKGQVELGQSRELLLDPQHLLLHNGDRLRTVTFPGRDLERRLF